MNESDDKLLYLDLADELRAQQADPVAGHATGSDEIPRAVLLSIDTGAYDAERSMAELGALAEADGATVVLEVLQKRAAPDRATVLGSGTLAEAKLTAQNMGATRAIFDGELSGSQLRNLEKRLDLPVQDRTMLILEIFKQRAVTREGKLQTELATLQYRLPRLAGLGSSLSRQGGGGGGGAGARRGGGESKLEYDRRYIRSRIAILKQRLADMEAQRSQTRRSRGKSGVPVVALVGYTNVGKSSLVNALTGSDIGAADMLFATLDPTARRTTLPDGQSVVLVDTVGFVSRLPHDLVAAFKSTLEEARYADLLLLVCDASDPEAEEQLQVTRQVLDELGAADTPRLTVYNKADKVPGAAPFQSGALAVSAATGDGLDALRAALGEKLAGRVGRVQLLLPYDQLALADVVRRYGHVETEEYRDEGLYLAGTLEKQRLHLVTPYLVRG